MEIQNIAYSGQSPDGPSKSEILNRELHRIVSTAIIHKNGKYLIVQRSPNKKAFPLKWTVPGGGLEVTDYINTPKTTPDAWYYAIENSLVREIKEEVNLDVEKPQFLLDLVFIRPDNIPVATLSYYCKYRAGEVKLNDENVDYKWITTKEAKDYDLISGIAEEIEMVDQILKGKDASKVKLNYYF
jgi:8-oxo-dGTP pyrophosphatase MutT (NUDIX family)